MGLDLQNPGGVRDTALSMTAHQTQQGQISVAGDASPERFGRAMPLIDPGNPGNSYIMYKVLANPLNQFRPGGALEPGLALEIDRLRDNVVVGLPMPAQSDDGDVVGMGGPASVDPEGADSSDRMRLISLWIAHGAVIDACAP